LIVAQDAKERIQHALMNKVSPLEVLLEQMHWYRERAEELTTEISKLAVKVEDPDSVRSFLKAVQDMGQFRQQARMCASEAAPYVHARLANIEYKDITPKAHTPPTPLMSPKEAMKAYRDSLDAIPVEV